MENNFRKIGIVYNPKIPSSFELAKKLSGKIKNPDIFSIDEMKENIDLAVVIGGDGSFLKAGRFYSKTNTPILGFNMGRLGYLAQAKPDEADFVIEKLKNCDYIVEDRLMLKANEKIALNDIVVKGTNCARSETFKLSINSKELCSYVADGIIISTPTGSTAYSMSAGGPIISPNLDCFLIVPICPHTLNSRPLIIPKNEKVTIEVQGKLNISYDGQVDIVADKKIEIEKNENCAKLLILNKQKDKFYDILKEKLHWSLSPKK